MKQHTRVSPITNLQQNMSHNILLVAEKTWKYEKLRIYLRIRRQIILVKCGHCYEMYGFIS